MEIATIREHFARPPAEFGPTPFWFLNDELDEQRLCRALEEMKSKDITGVVIHPRSGMEVEYLSDMFWDRPSFLNSSGVIAFGYEMPTHDEYGVEVSERLEALLGGRQRPGSSSSHLTAWDQSPR
ncbi:MAG: hypothetical protein JSV16_04395 [Candidatus Hydrogenedentota bacterium]|nr:MAG: hypothetical protein JSV16_04395 [Candidatus Hydrogenedentota bacterium]